MHRETAEKPRNAFTPLFRFCKETTAHGLAHIRKPNAAAINVIWLIAFLLALVMAVIGIGHTFQVRLWDPRVLLSVASAPSPIAPAPESAF